MEINWTLTNEDWERLRQGRVCLKCLDPQEEAFPETCANAWCGYEIRARQMRDLTARHRGEEHVGPATTLQQELDRLDETHEKRLHNPAASIWLPRGVSANGS